MPDTNLKTDLPEQLNFKPEADEQILWSARPRIKVFILNSILELFRIELFFITLFVVVGLLVLAITKVRWDVWDTLWGFAGLSFFVALYICWEARRLKKTRYIITNKHVIIFSAFRHYSTTTIRISGVQSMKVKRSFFDKRSGTALISLFSGEMHESEDGPIKVYDILYAVDNGEDVAALLNRIQQSGENVSHTERFIQLS